MNEITLNYDFNGRSVRVVGTYDEPWFIANDICEVLEISNPRQALSRLDDDEKGVITNDTPGGDQEMNTVSEAGLYSLILTSRKAEAKLFKRWVTHEVLPAIRKTGGYVHDVELFLTHPIMKDLEAIALEKVSKTVDQVHRLHLAPHIRRKFIKESPALIDAVLKEVQTYNSLYVADDDSNLRYLPKARRKAGPSRFVVPGWTEREAEDNYRMMHKHVTHPLLTLEEFKAKVCDRPAPGITPLR